jgi:Right handed beta helix region
MTKAAMPILQATIVLPLLCNVVQARPNQSPPPPTPQMRTYVSGSGSDSNPCTATAPCQTFQAALALTMPSGEIFVLDSANYGPAIINQAVTITSEGALAGVLAMSGVAITVNAGPSDVVNLRGLDIDGGNAGSVGIQFNSGQSLNIQKSIVRNFTNSGISFVPSATSALIVSDTVVAHNANNGIAVVGGSSSITGTLSRVTATANGVGVLASGSSVSLTVTDAVASGNNYGIAASSSSVMVRNSATNNNAVGIVADQSTAMVRVGQSTITGNGTGWQGTNGGQVQSFGNNIVGGNTTDGAATGTLALE